MAPMTEAFMANIQAFVEKHSIPVAGDPDLSRLLKGIVDESTAASADQKAKPPRKAPAATRRRRPARRRAIPI